MGETTCLLWNLRHSRRWQRKAFWDLTSRNPTEVYRCFGGTYSLCLQSKTVSLRRKQAGRAQHFVRCLFRSLFDPEDPSSTFLWNVGASSCHGPEDSALHVHTLVLNSHRWNFFGEWGAWEIQEWMSQTVDAKKLTATSADRTFWLYIFYILPQ